MSKHTLPHWKYLDKNGKFLDSKGWEAENHRCDNFSYVPVTDGKNVVALVVVKGDDEETLTNNARLIAASPLMYEYILKKSNEGDLEAHSVLESINA
jgi:hypothetical protein